MDSDEEADMDDIKRAQKLSFTMTNILETPEAHRGPYEYSVSGAAKDYVLQSEA